MHIREVDPATEDCPYPGKLVNSSAEQVWPDGTSQKARYNFVEDKKNWFDMQFRKDYLEKGNMLKSSMDLINRVCLQFFVCLKHRLHVQRWGMKTYSEADSNLLPKNFQTY